MGDLIISITFFVQNKKHNDMKKIRISNPYIQETKKIY